MAPFTENELIRVSEWAGQHDRKFVDTEPYLAYGTTLITAVVVDSFMVFWQIGDGDVLTVTANGGATQPLPKDELLIGDKTTSLCSVDSWRLSGWRRLGTPAPVILLSTDGLANSFQDDAGFISFGSDILQMLVTDGIEAVGDRLDTWLHEITQVGSGDDISLGIICRPGALSAFPLGLRQITDDIEYTSNEGVVGSLERSMTVDPLNQSGNKGTWGANPPSFDQAHSPRVLPVTHAESQP